MKKHVSKNLTEIEKLLLYLLEKPNSREELHILRKHFPNINLQPLCSQKILSELSPTAGVYYIELTAAGVQQAQEIISRKKSHRIAFWTVVIAVMGVIATVAVGFKDEICLLFEFISTKLFN